MPIEETQTETVESTSNQAGDTSTVTEGNEVFTQEQVNKLIGKRVKEVKTQYKDYEEIKQELAKQKELLETFAKAKKETEDRLKTETFTNALEKAARDLNLELDLATQLLPKDKIIYKDDKPDNLQELLKAVIEKHPQLVKRVVTTPDVSTTVTNTESKFTLHKSAKNNFWNGGGLRLPPGK
jgi:hypothetical protein